MNTDEKKYLNNKPIIIDADDNTSAIDQTEGEVPVITNEDDDAEETASVAVVVPKRHFWLGEHSPCCPLPWHVAYCLQDGVAIDIIMPSAYPFLFLPRKILRNWSDRSIRVRRLPS